MREGVVVLRASNDQVVDAYGTIITVEGLHDWAEGFLQHRTISQQHNQTMRGVEGRAQVGMATAIDFTPQLEVTVRVDDKETWDLIEARKLTGGSLEFVPAPGAVERRSVDGREVEVYHRLSPEPELCGLTLCDIPAVPGAELLELRGMAGNWQHAVVDPKVLGGEITDSEQIARLRWFDHHDPVTHRVDPKKLERALSDLRSGNVTVPAGASLTREQVIQRATAHLARHQPGLGVRSTGAQPQKGESTVNKWIRLRMQQYVEEGLSESEAMLKAQQDFAALPQTVQQRFTTEATREGAPADVRGAVHVHVHQGQPAQVATRAEPQQPAQAPQVGTRNQPEAAQQPPVQAPEQPAAQRRTRRDEWLQARTALHQAEGMSEADAQRRAQEDLEAAEPELRARLEEGSPVSDEQVARVLQANPAIRALLAQPENPQAAIAGYGRPVSRLQGEQLLVEVLARTVLPQLANQQPSSQQVGEAYRMLEAHGISRRALTVEANGTVIYEELARQFIVKPEPEAVFRNHMRSVPMGGTRKRTFPRFDGGGITHEWGRTSTAAIGESDPSLDTFDIEVTELNSKVVVPDSFSLFNAQGASFISEILLPAMRRQAQLEEDRQFFLSDGAAPNPATFEGLRNASGVTVVSASANGDVFVEEILESLIRAMPVRYRGNVSRLAFYLPVALTDDLLQIREARTTGVGDRVLEQDANTPGPMPVARKRGINVYAIPALPTDEDQGTATGLASTIYLVHRDIPVIGDALTLRIEPYRRENFINVLQLQEFVGLGYQWAEAIVRREGVLAADFS